MRISLPALKGALPAGSHIDFRLRFRDARGQEQELPLRVPVAAAAPAKH